MPNFAEKLRMRSIYGSGGNPFTPDVESPFALVNEFKRRFPQQQQPVIEQIGQQIAEPERQNVAYGMQITPFQQAQLELRRKEIESREGIAEGREETARQKLDVSKQRADVYEWKARNPGNKIIVGKDGITRGFNPITNEVVEFGRTGLSESEIADLEQKHAIKRIEATGGEARKTEEVRQQGRETLEEMRARHAREQAEFTSGLPSRTASLPSQQKNQLELNYNRLINMRPDLRDLVKRDTTTGEITVTSIDEKPDRQMDIEYINRTLFGAPKKDIKLPPEDKTNDAAKKAADLIKKYSGVK